MWPGRNGLMAFHRKTCLVLLVLFFPAVSAGDSLDNALQCEKLLGDENFPDSFLVKTFLEEVTTSLSYYKGSDIEYGYFKRTGLNEITQYFTTKLDVVYSVETDCENRVTDVFIEFK